MKERKTYLSLARVIGALAVVMIHTNGCFYEFNIEQCWTLANVIESGLGFAVPVFIMVSGATLMDYSKRYSTKEYFKKRVVKTVITYVVGISFVFNYFLPFLCAVTGMNYDILCMFFDRLCITHWRNLYIFA
ncbi:MAG: acyltransferase family protein [Agathobacter sp.]|nr:acyltransferase family protein [Agathobacter sp.]